MAFVNPPIGRGFFYVRGKLPMVVAYDILIRGMTVNRWEAVLRLTGVGFYIGGCIVGGLYLGFWLDGEVGIRPLFILLGLGLGLFVAFYGTYRMLLPIFSKRKDKGD
ncbi:MAG: AtpZ/AtpI family protein, partial [Dehalococcoidia bacterium]|nr:AtpZ/AtpI family protein [Dehalococcoidia bacterium]